MDKDTYPELPTSHSSVHTLAVPMLPRNQGRLLTHKEVQGILKERFPKFLTTVKFAQPPKTVKPCSRFLTPGRSLDSVLYVGSQSQYQGQPNIQQSEPDI